MKRSLYKWHVWSSKVMSINEQGSKAWVLTPRVRSSDASSRSCASSGSTTPTCSLAQPKHPQVKCKAPCKQEIVVSRAHLPPPDCLTLLIQCSRPPGKQPPFKCLLNEEVTRVHRYPTLQGSVKIRRYYHAAKIGLSLTFILSLSSQSQNHLLPSF